MPRLVKTNAPGQGDDCIDDQHSNEDIPAHLDCEAAATWHHGSVKEAPRKYHMRTPLLHGLPQVKLLLPAFQGSRGEIIKHLLSKFEHVFPCLSMQVTQKRLTARVITVSGCSPVRSWQSKSTWFKFHKSPKVT